MPLFGTKKMPSIKKASKYEHGSGVKSFTHPNKPVAGTGKSQSPPMTTIKRGR